MLSLETHVNSLNFSTELTTVKNLLDTAQVRTTFWGSRIVEVNGFTGSVYLEDIAKKIIGAGSQRSNADNLLPAERMTGLEIVRKLQDFYDTSDTQIRNSNCLTYFLNWIREFSCSPYTTRFYIEETAEENFRAYSEAKFLQQFGGVFGQIFEHPASDGCRSYPTRVFAKEDQIRALLPNS